MSELIDREATVKQICKMGDMVGGHDRDVVISIALFVQDDKTAFPTVERPHGTWRNYERALTCSVCNTEYDSDIMDYFGDVVPAFCPECGADMRKEGEAE